MRCTTKAAVEEEIVQAAAWRCCGRSTRCGQQLTGDEKIRARIVIRALEEAHPLDVGQHGSRQKGFGYNASTEGWRTW